MASEVAASANSRPWLFKPGQSGNPGGRSAMPADVREALEAGSLKAAVRLVELLDDPEPAVRLKAVEILHSRLYGKPVAAVDAKIERTDLGAMHLAALQQVMARGKQAEADKAGAEVIDVTPTAEIVEVIETIDPETGEILDDEAGEDD